MRRVLCAALVLGVLLLAGSGSAEAVSVSAEAAILMDADSGQVLYEKNADRHMLIASTTKLMTALVVLECAQMQDTVTVQPSHMAEGSSMYLKPGETVTVEELLYGLLLCSGNDAALALADACGGLETFVGAMNDMARRLGMADSSFANPNGLDQEGHYSTARDMAVLAARAAADPTLRRICSTTQADVMARTMVNHNKLLTRLNGCVGLKTGYTKAAGRTLVTCAVRDGRWLVAVTLDDGDDWEDHIRLYETAFAKEEAT